MNLKTLIFFLFVWNLTISGFAQTDLNDLLKNNHCRASLKLTQHDFSFFNRAESHKSFTVGNPGDNQEMAFQEGIWQMNYQIIDIVPKNFQFKN